MRMGRSMGIIGRELL
jgi:hypothetical protein